MERGTLIPSFFDLKAVNDQYGHETGDTYILLVSDVLKFVVDKKGVCIRWGGDEFLMITPNCETDERMYENKRSSR